LHATTTHTTTAARLESSPRWLSSSDLPGICLKQCALTSCTLSVTVQLKIGPLLIYTDPRSIPLGECAPTVVDNYALEIPPTKSGYNGLKLSALGSFVLGRKGFPKSDLMNSWEFKMYPLQLSHSHWLIDAPKMISPLELDEKLGNRCALPSSQLGQKGITGFSLAGTSRITKSP
jgi:hypothetical protein